MNTQAQVNQVQDPQVQDIVPSICRNCGAACPILVTLENGKPVKVTGDPEARLFEGYICPKGKLIADQYSDPNRLLRNLKRNSRGEFEEVGSEQLIDEVAEKLRAIIEKHGPESVALYFGGGILSQYVSAPMAGSFMKAIQSPMFFTASSIDKPAEKVALALHGNWPAGSQSFASSDAWMIVGANPIIAKSNGAPYNNPGRRLKEAVARGMKLIVVDPRRSETARRAKVHVQSRAGEDPTILAGIIHIVIAEELYDRDFIAENVAGFEALKQAVKPFTPEYVAARADIPAATLLEAARTFGRAKRGMAICSTGPSFSMNSNVTFYLSLCLNTICGRWTRAGEISPTPNVLLPAYTPKAQPQAPYPAIGERKMRARGFQENASGMPVAALPEEMLLEGKGQVKALISLGGNPMSAWPDTLKTEAGLKKLELLVQMDVSMSATAKMADYVVATPMQLEVPSTSYILESLKYFGPARAFENAWAQYTPALVSPPEGSDLIEDHAFFFRLAQKLGLQLEWINVYGVGKFMERPPKITPMDMSRVPSVDDLWELTLCDSRIPFDEIKRHPHGHTYDLKIKVEPRDPDCTDRLQVGDPMMMSDLTDFYQKDYQADYGNPDFPFRLLSRRSNTSMNSILVDYPNTSRKRRYNPAFMHPADIERLGVHDGDKVTVRSMRSEVQCIVESDHSLRVGSISLTHGFGSLAEDGGEYTGANVNALISLDEFDPITGIPRMSNIPVAVVPVM
jgi:anaerobic selenocysteine-containing dehydrogenase